MAKTKEEVNLLELNRYRNVNQKDVDNVISFLSGKNKEASLPSWAKAFKTHLSLEKGKLKLGDRIVVSNQERETLMRRLIYDKDSDVPTLARCRILSDQKTVREHQSKTVACFSEGPTCNPTYGQRAPQNQTWRKETVSDRRNRMRSVFHFQRRPPQETQKGNRNSVCCVCSGRPFDFTLLHTAHRRQRTSERDPSDKQCDCFFQKETGYPSQQTDLVHGRGK